MLRYSLATALIGLALSAGAARAAPEKVILDTDFNTIGDDGKVMIMAAQLHAEGKIELLAVTTVAGNNWLNQETAEALKAVERMGLAGKVKVYAGAQGPLLHDYNTIQAEKALFGGYIGGAWQRPKPADDKLTPPMDGFATKVKVENQHAMDYIIDTVKKYPHEVTILAIGPMTNVAMAIRKAPEIVPLIKRMVFMGGAFETRGNTTPAAEMNIWFDPEAARIVVREPLDMTFIPLDVTDTVPMDKTVFDRIVKDNNSIIAKLLLDTRFAKTLEENPKATQYIYDTLALAYIVDPSLATVAPDMWIDVDTGYGQGYGRTLGYPQARAASFMKKAKVILRFDNARFYDMFVDLLRRPVPVQFKK